MPDELNRWLRRVRPPTAADDDWAASEDGQRALTDIHRRSTRSGAARRMRVWTVLPAASLAAVAVAVLVVALVSNPRPAPTAPHALPRLTTTRPVAKFLTPFTSCATLLAGLRTHAQAHVASFGYGGYAYGQPMHGGPVLGPLVNSSAAGTTDTNLNAQTSTTNVQEIGVDEPDIVKTDGDRVVIVTDGRLRVIDAAKHVVTGTLDLSLYANAQSAQLLVSGDTAVVILRPGGYVSPGYAGPMISSLGPIPGGQGLRSTVLYVELSGAPTVSGSMLVDGDVVDARMVGSTVRLVVSSAPKITPPTPVASDTQNKARTRAALGKAPLSAWLPSYTLNTSSGATTHAVPCAQVSHPTDYTAASMLTIYTLDPTTPDADPQPVSLTADGDTVYATATSLYVASNPACGWCYGAAGTQPTQIHRFDITGAGKPTYLGSGSVPGSLLSQYSISDYAGSLRVATTIDAAGGIPTGADIPNGAGGIPTIAGIPNSAGTASASAGSGSNSAGAAPTSAGTVSTGAGTASTGGGGIPTSADTGSTGAGIASNSVYVLDAATLKVTGHVAGLGNGERIYAVRFLGPLGYVVTFRQTDPLYVLDLSDPANPRAVGSLQLTGYSSYLHDVGDGRLLGVGQDVAAERVAGLLVQLFDVRHPSAPTSSGRVVLSGTPGESQFDPHAFLFWKPTGLVVVPISTWSGPQMGAVLALRVSGGTLTKLGTIANRTGTTSVGQPGIQRSLIVNGSLWTLSSNGIRVSSQASLAEQAWIAFS